jgi:hypothetical protein
MISGTLPAQFSLLSNVQNVQLQSNSLSGTIPNLSNMTSLHILDIANNNFNGQLSPDICNLINLRVVIVTNLTNICAPVCLFETFSLVDVSSTKRCQGPVDVALCDFIEATNIADVIKRGSQYSTIIVQVSFLLMMLIFFL